MKNMILYFLIIVFIVSCSNNKEVKLNQNEPMSLKKKEKLFSELGFRLDKKLIKLKRNDRNGIKRYKV